MKKVRVFDIRHYDRDKVNKPEEQLPTPQGQWETQVLSWLLSKRDVNPQRILASVQPRAWRMAEQVAEKCGWKAEVTRWENLNDVSSDPNAEGIVDLAKRLAGMTGVSTETALLLHPLARDYMWQRSETYLSGLINNVITMEDGQSVVVFSHGGQVEMRFLRLLLTADAAIPFQTLISQQGLKDIDIGDLVEFGGMLRTGEGFSYALSIDNPGKIIKIENPYPIRLPEVPADL